MNKKLEFYFDRYSISERDRFDVYQIFNILSEDRKQNFLNNLDSFCIKLKQIDENIETEKSILISEGVERIKNKILENRKRKAEYKIRGEIDLLKQEL